MKINNKILIIVLFFICTASASKKIFILKDINDLKNKSCGALNITECEYYFKAIANFIDYQNELSSITTKVKNINTSKAPYIIKHNGANYSIYQYTLNPNQNKDKIQIEDGDVVKLYHSFGRVLFAEMVTKTEKKVEKVESPYLLDKLMFKKIQKTSTTFDLTVFESDFEKIIKIIDNNPRLSISYRKFKNFMGRRMQDRGDGIKGKVAFLSEIIVDKPPNLRIEITNKYGIENQQWSQINNISLMKIDDKNLKGLDITNLYSPDSPLRLINNRNIFKDYLSQDVWRNKFKNEKVIDLYTILILMMNYNKKVEDHVLNHAEEIALDGTKIIDPKNLWLIVPPQKK